MPGSLRFLLVVALFGAVPAAVYADDIQSPAENVDNLIKQLDADQFADRQTASDELSRLGSNAFPALEQAARSDSREASQRAIEILKKHYEGDDTETKQAARTALQRLAADTSTRGGRQADEVLNPPPPPTVARMMFGRPAVRVARANVRVQIPPARFVKRVHVKNDNGVKEIEVEENGRKLKVIEDPKGSIQVEVTDKKNGKETAEKYSAKDADELKQKHPEAHKIYEELGKQQQGGLRLQIGGAIVPQNAPANQPAPMPPNEAQAQELRKEAARRSLEVIDRHIQQLQQNFSDRPDVQRHIERLQEHRKQMEKQQGDLEKKAG